MSIVTFTNSTHSLALIDVEGEDIKLAPRTENQSLVMLPKHLPLEFAWSETRKAEPKGNEGGGIGFLDALQ